jgi:hypothetical protein
MVFSTSFAAINAKTSFNKYLGSYNGQEVHFLQIGAFNGVASSYMLEHVLTNSTSTLTDVDTWDDSTRDDSVDLDWVEIEKQYDARLHSSIESGRLIKKKMNSTDFFAHNSQKFDFIYIDGNKGGPAILQDGMNAVRCLKPTGLLAFNDSAWHQKNTASLGPNPAISALTQVFSDELSLLQTNNLVWLQRN